MAKKRGSGSIAPSDDTAFGETGGGFDVESSFTEEAPRRREQVRDPAMLEALLRREQAQARLAEKHGTAFYGYVVGRNQADWEELAATLDRPGSIAVSTDDIRDLWDALYDAHELLCHQLGRDPLKTTIGEAQEALLERLVGVRGPAGWERLRRP